MDFEFTSSASWDTEEYAGFQRVFLLFTLLILTPHKSDFTLQLTEQQPFIRKIKGKMAKLSDYRVNITTDL